MCLTKQKGILIEIDTNGDGVIANPDLNNNILAVSGVITTLVATRTSASASNSTVPLWISGGVTPNQAACNAIAGARAGQITLCFDPDENETVRPVFLSATDGNGIVFYQKAINAD